MNGIEAAESSLECNDSLKLGEGSSLGVESDRDRVFCCALVGVRRAESSWDEIMRASEGN